MWCDELIIHFAAIVPVFGQLEVTQLTYISKQTLIAHILTAKDCFLIKGIIQKWYSTPPTPPTPIFLQTQLKWSQ